MPIRFLCPFCDQLIGISRRKTGAVIECPRCHGLVGVPAEDGSPAGFVELVEPPPPPVPTVLPPESADIVLNTEQIVLLALVLLGLLLLAFLSGLLVGALF